MHSGLQLNNQYLLLCKNLRQQLQPSACVDTCVLVLYMWTLRFSLLVSLQLCQAEAWTPLRGISIIVLRPLLCSFGFMFGVAVMLENSSSPTLHSSCRLHRAFPQHFHVFYSHPVSQCPVKCLSLSFFSSHGLFLSD